MKNTSLIPCALGLMLAFIAVPAIAQNPAEASPAWPSKLFEKELGLATTYSVEQTISAMGVVQKRRLFRDGDKCRAEWSMAPFLDATMVQMEIPEGGKTATYWMCLEKKKYSKSEEMDLRPADAVQIKELGNENYEGVDCIKRRVTVMQAGVKSEITVLFASEQKNMPVKMDIVILGAERPGGAAMRLESTVHFKNYNFAAPDAELFRVPAGCEKIGQIMEILM